MPVVREVGERAKLQAETQFETETETNFPSRANANVSSLKILQLRYNAFDFCSILTSKFFWKRPRDLSREMSFIIKIELMRFFFSVMNNIC